MNIQFKKGVLELCVLSLLTKQNRYGYELVNEISKNIEISEGTIYPLLRRFGGIQFDPLVVEKLIEILERQGEVSTI